MTSATEPRMTMRAMRWPGGGAALSEERLPRPEPGPGQLLVKVSACGVCRTDLHVVDGELPQCRPPITPGHEIVGTVVSGGVRAGTRVGIPWLGWTCGECEHCRAGRENLCDQARFTGCHLDGGYAEYVLADERFCLPIPERYSDAEAAPLLCAGLIGFRSYSFVREAKTLGIYGFGAAAHIITQVARAEGRSVFAFTREKDLVGQKFALSCGAHWAGDSTAAPPEPLDAAIIFAPVGSLVPLALKAVRKGGAVICGGIHMSDIPSFPYELLWGERTVRSVANLTRADGQAFMKVADKVALKVQARQYPLADANLALEDLRRGRLEGAAVLVP
jgi:propanol-preferring alcohol dehydrogenase